MREPTARRQDYLEALTRRKLTMLHCLRMDETSPLWNFRRHSHDCLKLICFLFGDLSIRTDAQRLEAAPCSVVVHPPHMVHEEFPRAKGRREVIDLWLDGAPSGGSSFQVVDREGTLRWLFGQLCAEHRRPQADSTAVTDAYLTLLLHHLCRAGVPQGEDTFALVTAYICANYASPLRLEQLAALSAVSSSYLERLFRRRLQTTPIAYLPGTHL